MKICIVNGSPKPKDSASSKILEALKQRLGNDCEYVDFHAMHQSDLARGATGCAAIVIAFPLYIDGIPSHLLRVLDESREGFDNQLVFAIVNNGFYEGKQNSAALDMIRNWVSRAGLRWGKGIGVGAGGMVGAAQVGKGPMAPLGKVLDELADDILQQRQGENHTFEPAFPRWLYKTAAHMGWNNSARANGVSRRDIRNKTANDY